MQTLDGLLRIRAAATPDRPPLVFPKAGAAVDAAPTYAELQRLVEQNSALLHERVGPGERALLVYPTGPAFVAMFFGCLAAGVIAVPVPPPVPGPMRERFAAVVADCAPAAVLTTAEWSGLFDFGAVPVLAAENEPGARVAEPVTPRSDPDGIAYLQYSSGTTGAPRGIVVTHANALANCAMIESVFNPGGHEKTVGWMPHFHDFGLVTQILIAVFEDRSNVVMDPLDFVRNPEEWLRQITRHAAQFTPMPAFACALLLRRVPAERRARYDLSSVRAAGIGAETLSHDDLAAFADGFADAGLDPTALLPCYGMAEAVAFVASCPPGTRWTAVRASREALGVGALRTGDADGLSLVSSGVPAPGVRIRIVDPDTRAALPAGGVGEILLAGDNITRGYWGRPDPREAVDGVRYLPTGDLGAMLDGELFVIDRLADRITIDGRDHYPVDLERTALSADAGFPLSRAVAFAVDDTVVLIVEAGGRDIPDSASQGAAAIAAAVTCRHHVAVGDVVIAAKGTIAATTSGKAKRSMCRERYLAARPMEAAR